MPSSSSLLFSWVTSYHHHVDMPRWTMPYLMIFRFVNINSYPRLAIIWFTLLISL